MSKVEKKNYGEDYYTWFECITVRQTFYSNITNKSWHYSCPRSVYCRSIVSLVFAYLFKICRFISKIFTYSYFHAEGEIKTGDAAATVNALIQSIYPALIKHSQKYTRKDLITSGNFPLFLFYYLHPVHFKPAWKRRSARNLSFDQFTFAL